MTSDYQALTSFVRTRMLEAELPINPLKITRSAIKSILDQFSELGWSVEVIPKESRHKYHTVTSPDGTESLSMIGGKVYRHPSHTEEICRRKHLTKRMLDLDGLPTPVGGDFSPKDKAIAAAYFQKMPKPAVVKPVDAGGSHGVTVGVRDASEFDRAWEYALSEGRNNSNVLVEQFVRGVELRPYVIGDEVVSVVARIQPFAVGDGRTNLDGLIAEAHEAREVNYRAMKLPIIVDWEFVKKNGFDRDSVPPSGEIVFLNPFCYPTIGAAIVDVTDSVSDEIKDIARRAKNSIPNLEIAGIDLLVENLDDARTAFVIEVNTAAALDMHRYPTHGGARAIDEDIVQYFHTQYMASRNLQ